MKTRNVIFDKPIGFGKHASLTGRRLVEDQPGYCDWLISEGIAEFDNESFLLLKKLYPELDDE